MKNRYATSRGLIINLSFAGNSPFYQTKIYGTIGFCALKMQKLEPLHCKRKGTGGFLVCVFIKYIRVICA